MTVKTADAEEQIISMALCSVMYLIKIAHVETTKESELARIGHWGCAC